MSTQAVISFDKSSAEYRGYIGNWCPLMQCSVHSTCVVHLPQNLTATFLVHQNVRKILLESDMGVCTMFEQHALISRCSDITNTLVGISGETVPGGRNLRIYYVHSGAICGCGSNI